MPSSFSYLSARKRLEFLAFVILVSLTLLFALLGPVSINSQASLRGTLTIATRNSATTFYTGPEGAMGPEYDLALAFAQRLGLAVEVVIGNSQAELIGLLRNGKADMAVAVKANPQLLESVRLSPPYTEITSQVVYRSTGKRPDTIDDLGNGRLEVVAGSEHARHLRELKAQHPELRWTENAGVDSEELLNLVWNGIIDYTVTDSNEITLNRRFYPELRVAFDLAPPQELVWAFSKHHNTDIYEAAVEFFGEISGNGELKQILERYYGHVEGVNDVDTQLFRRNAVEKLHRFRPLFEQAGERYGFDWRLLAAVSYQESHWNPRARSPTGVRGMMMLTQATAEHLGIENRLDPKQSVMGGAEYLARVKKKIPERITEPDRTWMALAAYNVGFGHLEDARKLTEYQGGDPDKWIDVMERLPLLRQRQWYRLTKFGYARGDEPVTYVQNIRSYYDLLVWLTTRGPAGIGASRPLPYDVMPPAL